MMDISGDSSISADDTMAMAMLASAKCRIMFSKKIVPAFEYAYFEGVEGKNDIEIPVYDYGDEWCAEIPFIMLYAANEIKTDRLVVICP